MKKKYVSPASSMLAVQIESSILEGSQNLTISDGTVNDVADIRSNRGGWDSSAWTGGDEEE